MDEDWLSQLTPDQLRAVSGRLLSELKQAKDKLNQHSGNSSRPPSSAAPWAFDPRREKNPSMQVDAAATGTQLEPRKPEPELASSPSKTLTEGGATTPATSPSKPASRKPGKQRGAKGHGRMQKLAVTDVENHFPPACAICGSPFSIEEANAYTGWDEVDIIEKVAGQIGLHLRVTRHLLHSRSCYCGHTTRAEHFKAEDDPLWENVELGQWRLIGPRLAATIVFLAMRMRLSRARIAEFFHELFGLQLSTGVIDETVREAGRCVAPLEDALVKDIEEAALLHVDETSWPEAGTLLWLWVFVGQYTKLYFIGSRSMEMLANVLGEKFQGDCMSDGYLAYRHLPHRLRCWAHLLRKLQGLADSTDASVAATGAQMLNLFVLLMHAIYAARQAQDQLSITLASQYANEIARLRSLCESHAQDSHDKLRAVAREFLFDWDVILRQVAEPHLPLTNNLAEQALRHWVIARSINYGTRSHAGTRAYALLASVIDTCRIRAASAWDFLTAVITLARVGIALPSLPNIPVGM